MLQEPLTLGGQLLPHGLIDGGMADDFQAPHEFDALEQWQRRCSRGPVVAGEPFVAQNGAHLCEVQATRGTPFEVRADHLTRAARQPPVKVCRKILLCLLARHKFNV